MAWIILNHIVERIAGGEFVGNPDAHWPPLAERVAQFATPAGTGLPGALLTTIRDIGWLGDQGVTLFLIASGFGIACSLGRRGAARVRLMPFFRARAARIYPAWLVAHGVLLVVLFATWAKIGPAFVLSAAGIRFLPQTMYAFVPAWWYVGLLLQLYAVVPFLWPLMRRYGDLRVLAVTCAIAFAVRGAGLFLFHGYVDAWARGAIFVTRLPEFVFGMALAGAYAADPIATMRRLRRPTVRLYAAIAFACGFAAAFSLAGMIIAPFLMGVGAFALLLPVLDRGRPGFLAWTGRHSYALYLVHQPFVDGIVPASGTVPVLATSLRTALAVGLSAGAARLLEVTVDLKLRAVRVVARRPLRDAITTVAGLFIVTYGLLVAADLIANRFAPLEINGWGERPSLEPDAAVGWKLVPSRTTHLRWTSYDYTVRSNALGFPGDDVPTEKPTGSLRVLVTGDAFTSGEGVGTSAAWPALLGPILAEREHRDVSVLNFAITGYGPDQEARVVRIYAPRYRPDVVVFESFVNAFEKLDQTDDAIRSSIGFGRPQANAASVSMRLLHLRAFLSEDVVDTLRERISGRPSAEDVGLADASAFARDDPDFAREATAYRARLRAARDATMAAGAAFVLVMIPSRAQACTPADFPRGAGLDLTKDPAYDAERPERTAREAARALNVPFLDLRPALRAGGICRYQRANMHFLSSGDAATASAVAAALASLHLQTRDARAGTHYPPG